MDDLNEILGNVVKEGVDVNDVVTQLGSYISSETEKQVSKLAANKDQILQEKRSIREEFDGYKNKYGWADELEGFSQETYADLQSQVETLRMSQSQSMEELQQKLEDRYTAGKKAVEAQYDPKLKARQLEIEQIASERDGYKSKFQDYLVRNKLRSAIDQVGAKVDDFWFEGFMNKAQTSFTEEGLADVSVMHGDSYIPIEDWVNVFPTTDAGKRVIPAGFNSGGNSRGGTAGSKSANAVDISKLDSRDARIAKLKELYAKGK